MEVKIFSLFLVSKKKKIAVVPCNFTFQESIANYPERIITQIINRNSLAIQINSDAREFHCDDDESDDESVAVPYRLNFRNRNKNARPSIRLKPTEVDSRFGTTEPVPFSKEASPFSDDEEAFSDPICPTYQSRIFPKTLPNLLNQLVVVVNHGKFQQEVVIEKCR